MRAQGIERIKGSPQAPAAYLDTAASALGATVARSATALGPSCAPRPLPTHPPSRSNVPVRNDRGHAQEEDGAGLGPEPALLDHALQLLRALRERARALGAQQPLGVRPAQPTGQVECENASQGVGGQHRQGARPRTKEQPRDQQERLGREERDALGQDQRAHKGDRAEHAHGLHARLRMGGVERGRWDLGPTFNVQLRRGGHAHRSTWTTTSWTHQGRVQKRGEGQQHALAPSRGPGWGGENPRDQERRAHEACVLCEDPLALEPTGGATFALLSTWWGLMRCCPGPDPPRQLRYMVSRIWYMVVWVATEEGGASPGLASRCKPVCEPLCRATGASLRQQAAPRAHDTL